MLDFINKNTVFITIAVQIIATLFGFAWIGGKFEGQTSSTQKQLGEKIEGVLEDVQHIKDELGKIIAHQHELEVEMTKNNIFLFGQSGTGGVAREVGYLQSQIRDIDKKLDMIMSSIGGPM